MAPHGSNLTPGAHTELCVGDDAAGEATENALQTQRLAHQTLRARHRHCFKRQRPRQRPTHMRGDRQRPLGPHNGSSASG